MSPRGGRQILLAGAFVLVATLVALGVGPAAAGPADVWDALTGGDAGLAATIVREVRLPRVLLGLLVGACLALSGAVLQALLRNDLAEPYLVGVGPGAFLGLTVAALVVGALPSPWLRAGSALLGALAVTLLVFTFARRTARAVGPTLLLAGLAIGAFVSAVATGLLYGAVQDWHRVVRWLLGHLAARPGLDLLLVAGVLAAALAVLVARARDLDAIALGEEGAWLVGVRVRRVVVLLGLVAAVLAAVAVATSGLVGFVGLLVPHLARGWVGATHRRLLPVVAALGAGLLVLADAVARTIVRPGELPVGIVTAALGAPLLAAILLRPRRTSFLR